MPTPQDFKEIVVLKLLWRGLLARAWGKKLGFYEFCGQE
jgi:hypothetical protein